MKRTVCNSDLDPFGERVVGLPFFVYSRVHVTVLFFERGFFSRGFAGMLGKHDGHGAESEALGTDVDLVDGGIDVVSTVPSHAEKTGATKGIDRNMFVGIACYAACVGERG